VTPKLPVVTAREIVRVASKIGFVFDRQKGSHAVYVRSADGARVVVSIHSAKAIKPKTLAGILDDMRLTPEEFRQLL